MCVWLSHRLIAIDSKSFHRQSQDMCHAARFLLAQLPQVGSLSNLNRRLCALFPNALPTRAANSSHYKSFESWHALHPLMQAKGLEPYGIPFEKEGSTLQCVHSIVHNRLCSNYYQNRSCLSFHSPFIRGKCSSKCALNLFPMASWNCKIKPLNCIVLLAQDRTNVSNKKGSAAISNSQVLHRNVPSLAIYHFSMSQPIPSYDAKPDFSLKPQEDSFSIKTRLAVAKNRR